MYKIQWGDLCVEDHRIYLHMSWPRSWKAIHIYMCVCIVFYNSSSLNDAYKNIFTKHTGKERHMHTPAECHCPVCPPGLGDFLVPLVAPRAWSCCQWCSGWSCAGCCCHYLTQTGWGRQSLRPAWQATAAVAALWPSGPPAGSLLAGCTASGT